MTTYRLITTNPLKIITKNVSGKPAIMVVKDGYPAPEPPNTWQDYWPALEDWPADIKQPPLYAYVIEQPYPTEPAPEGEEYIRLLTTTEYGWTTQPMPAAEIDYVTRIQMRDVLIDEGLDTSIETILAEMPETTDLEIIEKKKMAEWWNHAPNFRRDNDRIATMQVALGLTDAEVDDLFTAASLVD